VLALTALVGTPLALVAWAWADRAAAWEREQPAGSSLSSSLVPIAESVALGLLVVAVVSGSLAAVLILGARARSRR
jgi:hypothetical protein